MIWSAKLAQVQFLQLKSSRMTLTNLYSAGEDDIANVIIFLNRDLYLVRLWWPPNLIEVHSSVISERVVAHPKMTNMLQVCAFFLTNLGSMSQNWLPQKWDVFYSLIPQRMACFI